MYKKKQLKFMASFSGWGSTASRLEPLRGGSLLFTSKKWETTCSKIATPYGHVSSKNCIR